MRSCYELGFRVLIRPSHEFGFRVSVGLLMSLVLGFQLASPMGFGFRVSVGIRMSLGFGVLMAWPCHVFGFRV